MPKLIILKKRTRRPADRDRKGVARLEDRLSNDARTKKCVTLAPTGANAIEPLRRRGSSDVRIGKLLSVISAALLRSLPCTGLRPLSASASALAWNPSRRKRRSCAPISSAVGPPRLPFRLPDTAGFRDGKRIMRQRRSNYRMLRRPGTRRATSASAKLSARPAKVSNTTRP